MLLLLLVKNVHRIKKLDITWVHELNSVYSMSDERGYRQYIRIMNLTMFRAIGAI